MIDASYPQFDGATADFSAVNRQLAATTNKLPTGSSGPRRRQQRRQLQWTGLGL